jgi:hypothetical protein
MSIRHGVTIASGNFIPTRVARVRGRFALGRINPYRMRSASIRRGISTLRAALLSAVLAGCNSLGFHSSDLEPEVAVVVETPEGLRTGSLVQTSGKIHQLFGAGSQFMGAIKKTGAFSKRPFAFREANDFVTW